MEIRLEPKEIIVCFISFKSLGELCFIIMNRIVHILQPWNTWKYKFDRRQHQHVVKWKETPPNKT